MLRPRRILSRKNSKEIVASVGSKGTRLLIAERERENQRAKRDPLITAMVAPKCFTVQM
jgi:hypothetical protein